MTDPKRRSSKRRASKRRTSSSSSSSSVEPVRVLSTIWTYSSMLWAFVAVYILQAFAHLYNTFKERKWTRKEELIIMGSIFRRTQSLFVVQTNPFWRLHTKYDMPMEQLPKRAIYMSNHISFADPFVLCSAQQPIETKYVGKGDLWDYPIAGRALSNAGDMPVHFVRDPKHGRWRARTGNASELMATAEDYLWQDIPITIFPEGTITRTDNMMPFKKGFFQLAVELECPIIPVAMWGNQNAWPVDRANKDVSSGGFLLDQAEMHVHVGTPIDSKGLTVDELLIKTFNTIQDMRNALPGCDLPPEKAFANPLPPPKAAAKEEPAPEPRKSLRLSHRKSSRVESVRKSVARPESERKSVRKSVSRTESQRKSVRKSVSRPESKRSSVRKSLVAAQ